MIIRSSRFVCSSTLLHRLLPKTSRDLSLCIGHRVPLCLAPSIGHRRPLSFWSAEPAPQPQGGQGRKHVTSPEDLPSCRFDRLGGQLREDRELPNTKWLPTEEFPALLTSAKHTTSDEDWETVRRIAKSIVKSITQPKSVFALSLSVCAIYLIAVAEGSLVVLPESFFSHPLLVSQYVARYALEQTMVSAVWGSQDARVIAIAIGMEPDAIIKPACQLHTPASASEASVILWLYFLWASRSLVASSTFLSQLLRIFSLAMRASDAFVESVRLGREPMFRGTEQRVIRLCGVRSDVTEVSLVRYGRHIVPVYEQPDKVGMIVKVHSSNYRVPVFWHVEERKYSFERSWAFFGFSSDFFLSTTTGRRMLYLEADLTDSEKHLCAARRSTDLTMEDASQAFVRIGRTAQRWQREHDAKKFRSFRVVLGNPRQLSASRGRSLRERIDTLNEADVLIDSQAPVVGELLRWCAKMCTSSSSEAAGSEARCAIAVETDSSERFEMLQAVLLPFGYNVIDVAEAEAIEQAQLEQQQKETANGSTPETQLEQIPRLVHCSTTAQTLSSVQALVKPRLGQRGRVLASRCCALLDRAERVEALKDAHDERHNKHAALLESLDFGVAKGTEQSQGLHIICTAVLYDDLLRQVRVWARLGHSPTEIQKELDSRFETVATILDGLPVSSKRTRADEQ